MVEYDFTLDTPQKAIDHQKRLKEDSEYKEAFLIHRENQRKEWWSGLKPFKESHEVPTLPNPLTPFYIERLIQLGAIPITDLIHGQWYYGNYRNANLADWDSQNQVFHHLRYKFRYRWDICKHFQHDDGLALFTPLRLATPDEVKSELANVPADI
jgi:hypothetical protein